MEFNNILNLGSAKNDSGSANWGDIGGNLNNQTDLKNALGNKANKDLNNITNTAKDNITNIVGWEKIEEFEINNVAEIEFTGLNDRYQHRFEFTNILTSLNAYMMAVLGNSTNYINNGYSGCLFGRWSQATNQWLLESVGYENSDTLIITSNQNEQWFLNRLHDSYVNFEIKSNLSDSRNQFFEFNSMVNSSQLNGRLMITNGNGMLDSGLLFDRIKFYLSTGIFTGGTVKHYIMK